MSEFPVFPKMKQKDKRRRIVMITPEDHEAAKSVVAEKLKIPYRDVTYEQSLKEIVEDMIKPIDFFEQDGYKGPLVLEKDKFGFRDNGERVRITYIPTTTTNESTSLKCCITPFRNQISSQRSDLFHSQLQNSVMPIFTETPVVMSCLQSEVLSISTAIKKVKGKVIKLLRKFRFQHRTVYIFELDGIVDVYDSEKTLINNGFSSPLRTDLELLEEGVEYDIGSSESDTLYKAYPSQYDPVTRIPTFGRNIVTCVTVDVANADDSVRASESFMRKFAAIRTKEINIKLNKKRILNRMPKIGEIINKPVLLKIVPDTGDIQTMCQDLNIPSGAEDENIYCEPNSYVSKIEVWSNEPLEDPELEELRQELLNFRHSIAAFLLSVPDDKLSRRAARYKDNYSYSEFRTEDAEISYPLIKITINSLDIPDEGYKFNWTVHMATCARNTLKSWNTLKPISLVA